MPSHFIIQREIKKSLRGENFFANDKKTGKAIDYEGVTAYEYNYYYGIFRKYENFGLPHNSGWANEEEWLLDMIDFFISTKNSIENFIYERNTKNTMRHNG